MRARRCGVKDVEGEEDELGNENLSRRRRSAEIEKLERKVDEKSTKTKSNSKSKSKSTTIQNDHTLSRWDKNKLTYYVTNNPTRMSSNLVRQVFRKATNIWSRYSGIKFIETKRPEIADIRFTFKYRLHEDGSSNAFDGPGGALAHAFFPKKGEAHFDVEEKWASGLFSTANSRGTGRAGSGYSPHGSYHGQYQPYRRRMMRSSMGRDKASLLAVAAHEMGHILGLPHSPIRGSLMSPYYDDYRRNTALAFDDIQAIEYLYGKTANAVLEDRKRLKIIPAAPSTTKNNQENPVSPIIRYDNLNQKSVSPVSRFKTPLDNKNPYQTKDRCVRRDIHDIDVDANNGNLRIMKNMNYYVWSPDSGYILKKRISRTWERMSGYVNAIVTSKLRDRKKKL